MSELTAYQDLMTALVARRPDQSAAADERVVLAALEKHAHELAAKLLERGDEATEEADAEGGRTTPSDSKYDKAATWYAAAKVVAPARS